MTQNKIVRYLSPNKIDDGLESEMNDDNYKFSQLYNEQFEEYIKQTFNPVTLKKTRAGSDIDKLAGIDYIALFKDGSASYIQTKILRHYQAKYNTITVEYFNNHAKRLKGEWFNSRTDYYISAYAASDNPEDGWQSIACVNFPKLKEKFKGVIPDGNNIGIRKTRTENGTLASFVWFDKKYLSTQGIDLTYNETL